MYLLPMRISRPDFETMVRRVMRRLPDPVQRHLNEVIITVQRRPSRKLLREMEVPKGETLLGYYSGANRLERSTQDLVQYPDIVYLFQEPLMGMCRTRAELEQEIADTIIHEIAHYLGIEEGRLEELGYG
jgi:predicted Zn-dependent protease with MMP-like domain